MKNLFLTAAFALATTTTFAQTTDQKKTQNTQQTTEADKQFVMKALQGGTAEIRKGTLARSKSKNPEIVKYGDMMENDHHSVNKKLKQLAQKKGYDVQEKLTPEDEKMYNSLEKLTGEAFDREFVNQMIMDHRKTIDLFKKQIANGTDQELKDIAASTLPTLETHLREIERMQTNMNKTR